MISEKKRLSRAVADKLKVIRAYWKDHYAWVDFVGDRKEKFYCNYNYLRYLLRCRLFYESSPFCIINQYFYNELLRTDEGDFMTGYPNLREKLLGKDEKEIAARITYLGSDRSFHDARKLCK